MTTEFEILQTSFKVKQDALQFLKDLGFGGYETYQDRTDNEWHFRLTPIGRQRREAESGKRK